jgi:hypothetical protein
MIKLLLYILPFMSVAQTWTMQHDHKLLPQKHYVVDSIIGNGRTLYLQCNSTLHIKHYAEHVKFATMRFTYERCRPNNTISLGKGFKAVKVVYSKKCITFKPSKI